MLPLSFRNQTISIIADIADYFARVVAVAVVSALAVDEGCVTSPLKGHKRPGYYSQVRGVPLKNNIHN